MDHHEVIDVLALKRQNAELRKLYDAVENLVQTKGRFHTEHAFNVLGEIYWEVKNAGVVPQKAPRKERAAAG